MICINILHDRPSYLNVSKQVLYVQSNRCVVKIENFFFSYLWASYQYLRLFLALIRGDISQISLWNSIGKGLTTCIVLLIRNKAASSVRSTPTFALWWSFFTDGDCWRSPGFSLSASFCFWADLRYVTAAQVLESFCWRSALHPHTGLLNWEGSREARSCKMVAHQTTS